MKGVDIDKIVSPIQDSMREIDDIENIRVLRRILNASRFPAGAHWEIKMQTLLQWEAQQLV